MIVNITGKIAQAGRHTIYSCVDSEGKDRKVKVHYRDEYDIDEMLLYGEAPVMDVEAWQFVEREDGQWVST